MDKTQLQGKQGFNEELLMRISTTYPELFELVESGLIVDHKDLDLILDSLDKGDEIYIYTGRGPSSGSLHFGHYLPFYITKRLQEILNAKVVIQITDDEKYLYYKPKKGKDKKVDNINHFSDMAMKNIADIISFGFDPKNTFIFRNTDFIGKMYTVDLEIKKHFTINQIKHTFGVGDSDNVGRVSYPTLQMVPCVPKVFDGFVSPKARCLIPCADDQDVYFRLARDILKKMKVHKPSMVFVGYVPSLQSVKDKMSSSKPETAIFMTDTNKQIIKKINKAFSGGRETVEKHKELGGDCDVDVPLNILKYFVSIHVYKKVKSMYGNGELMSGELKKIVYERLISTKEKLSERRKSITDEDIRTFMNY